MSDVEYIDYLKNGCYMMPREVSNMLAPYPIQFRIYEHFLKNAVFKPEGIIHAGIKLNRGQLLKSLSLLRTELYFLENNKRSYYPRKTLTHNLSKLEEKGLIKFVSTSILGTVYEIVIYNVFQDLESYSNDTLHKLRTTLAQSLHNHRTDLAQTLHKLDTTLAQTLQHKNKGNEVTNVLNVLKEKNDLKESEGKGNPPAPDFIFFKKRLERISNSYKNLYIPISKDILKASGLNNITDKMKLPLSFQWYGLKYIADEIEYGLFDKINLEIDNKEELGVRYKDYLKTFYQFLNFKMKDDNIKKATDDELFFYAINSINYKCKDFDEFNKIFDITKYLYECVQKQYELLNDEFQLSPKSFKFLKVNKNHVLELEFQNIQRKFENEYYLLGQYIIFETDKVYIDNIKNDKVFFDILKYKSREVDKDLLGIEFYYYLPSDKTRVIFEENELYPPNEDTGEIQEYINSQLENQRIESEKLRLEREKQLVKERDERAKEMLEREKLNEANRLKFENELKEKERIEKEKQRIRTESLRNTFNEMKIKNNIYSEYIDDTNSIPDIEDFIKERLSDNDYDFSTQIDFLRANSELLLELKNSQYNIDSEQFESLKSKLVFL